MGSNFTYDPVGQLTSAQMPSAGKFPGYSNLLKYDANGNRLQDSMSGSSQIVDNEVFQNQPTQCPTMVFLDLVRLETSIHSPPDLPSRFICGRTENLLA